MAAEIVSIDDISADGVADLSVDEQLAVEANDGDGDDDASWRLLSNFRCSVTLDRSHLDADKDCQPFVKLAAQHMKTQLERACRQSVFPRSDQLLRGARDDEWY